MTSHVLIVYGTRTGATAEVAEALGEVVRQQGMTVEVRPAKEVRTLPADAAVVVGAPLYMGKWHRDARRFLKRHRRALQDRPVAIFALGPFEDKPDHWDGARDQLAKALAKFPGLDPLDTKLFGGRFDMSKLGFPFTVLPALQEVPPSDLRDWDEVRAWGEVLAQRLD